jgi:hypothetical protein
MKIAILALMLLPSCVGTYMRTPQWTVARLSILSNHSIPSMTVSRDGDATLTGYAGAPDSVAVGAMAKGVVGGITGL